MLKIRIMMTLSEVSDACRDLVSLNQAAVIVHVTSGISGFVPDTMSYAMADNANYQVIHIYGRKHEDDLAIAILTGSINQDRLETVNVARVQLDS